MRAAASGRASFLAAADMSRRRRSSTTSPVIAAASVSPFKPRSSTVTAAPARATTSAFLRWWSSAACGNGTRIGGRSRRGQLGERGRARAADDHVRGLHLAVDFVDEGLDAGLQAGALVRGAHQIQIALAGLVGDRKAYPGGCQPRRCLHHGHVDRVRPLRTAKDQDPCRVARLVGVIIRLLVLRRKELRAHGIAGHESRAREIGQRRLEIHRRRANDRRQQPIGAARHRVLLEQHRRVADSAAIASTGPDAKLPTPTTTSGRRLASTRHASSAAIGSSATPIVRSTRDLPFSPAT